MVNMGDSLRGIGLHVNITAHFSALMLLVTWLGGRKGIRPVKTEWWGTFVIICLGEVQICVWPR